MNHEKNCRHALTAALVSLLILSGCATPPCKPTPKIPASLLVRPMDPVLIQQNLSKSTSKTDEDGNPVAGN